MTTLPPNYLRLSSKWLETNPLPFDSHYRTKGYAHWNPYLHSNKVTCEKQREEYEFATRRTDLPREAYADSEPGERAEDHCGVSSVEVPAKVLHTEKVRMKIGPEGVESVETDSERTIATLRAQLDAKEAEVEHRAKQRDEFQNLFIEASDGFNRRGEQLARLTAELDAVRKERDQFQERCSSEWAVAVERDAAQARCGALERAAQDERRMDWIIDNCTISGGGNGFELRVFIPVDSECIRDAIDRIICADNADHERRPDSVSPIPVVKESSSATLTPSQQPDNLKGGEPCAQTVSVSAQSTKDSKEHIESQTQTVQSTESASNPQPESPIPSGVGHHSRPEPVKAGEWHKPNVDDAIGGEMLGYHPEWVHEEFCPDGIRSCIHDGEMWHSSTWRDDDSNILRHSYSLAPLLVRPLPAPPIAPEGKAT